MDELAREVGAGLKKARAMLVTAESCTGGWVAQALTSIAGSSEWFERGFVTYSDDSKRDLLGVRKKTLDAHGAVSEQTAREMAQGALARSKGTLAVAITGVAGPGGGSPGKPVGMVCFAWSNSKKTVVQTRQFSGDRERVRRQSVIRALEGVLETLAGG